MLNDYPELNLALADMAEQNACYQPTSFWHEASSRIVESIRQQGIECFRSQILPLSFFVPTYGTPGSGFSDELKHNMMQWLRHEQPSATKTMLSLEHFLSGQMAALADYRVVVAADDVHKPPFLHHFSESTAGHPVEQFEFDGRRFSRSALNYLMGLAMLKKHLSAKERIQTVLEIGGGFGSLGEILFSSGSDAPRYINLDIPPTNFVAQWYLQQAVGEAYVTTHAATRHLSDIAIDELTKIAVLCAWQIEQLRGKIDVFVNFISFQEMEPSVVQNYLHHVARLETRWILLRNLREGKQQRTAKTALGVEKPILGDDYLNMLPNYTLVQRHVHPYGYRTVDGFHSELMLFRKNI